MTESSSIITELETLLSEKIGIRDRTLAEYIYDLRKQGADRIREELADFPSDTVESIVCLIQFSEKKSLASSTKTVASSYDGVSENPNVKRSASDILSDDVDIDIVVDHNIPESLLGESSVELSSYSPKTSNALNTSKQKSWLNIAADYTGSKIVEISRNLDNTHINMDVLSPSKQANSHQRETQSPGKKNVLPVHGYMQDIIQAVAESPIVIVVGDTGSGKTTQITQFLHSAGYNQSGKIIACTQPRRLAAISIAERVSQEMGCLPVGNKVGYSVRFDDCTSKNTDIKYMTDGILLREIIADPDLLNYSVIMLDEAHERTVATDVLFALLKAAVARRPDLRIIVTSATLDAERFASYFYGAPILRIPGRTFPVTIKYSEEPVLDYMEAALAAVNRIHAEGLNSGETGDILVFLTGQSEIELASSTIAERYPRGELYAVPVYAAIPNELQSLIFDPAPPGRRKVVLATNIAETSLTIDGIRFVVDTGFAKARAWEAKISMGVLKVQPISRAQADQRAGRAGRMAPGICYRLYTKTSFEQEMLQSSPPEIQREDLGYVVLLLKNIGISDIINFDFMDAPPKLGLMASLRDLYLLGAINANAEMTPTGTSMAKFPLEPALAKILITARSQDDQCLQDVLTIIAMLSMPSVFYRPAQPATKKAEADRMHQRFHDSTGDHITLLKVYNRWVESGSNKKWCTANYIQYKTLIKVKDARKQLSDLVNQSLRGISGPSKRNNSSPKQRNEMIIRTLCSGFFQNIAKLQNDGGTSEYSTVVGGVNVSIHPSSVLFRKRVPYVLYSSLTLTSREYMHICSQINPEWLIESTPGFYKKEDEKDARKRQRGSSIKPLFNKFAGSENEWRVSEHQKTLTRKR